MCLRLTLPRVGDANSAAAASLFGDRALLGDALIGDALIGDALIGDALLGEGSGKSRDDFRGDSRGARGACSSEVNMLMSALAGEVASFPRDFEMRSPTRSKRNEALPEMAGWRRLARARRARLWRETSAAVGARRARRLARYLIR